MTDTKSRRDGLRVPVDAVPRRSAVHDVSAPAEPAPDDRVDSVDIPIEIDDEGASPIEVEAPTAESSIAASSDAVMEDNRSTEVPAAPADDEESRDDNDRDDNDRDDNDDDKSPAVMLVQDLPPVNDSDQEIDDPLFGLPSPLSAEDALAATERALMATAPPAPRNSDKPPAPDIPPDPATPTLDAPTSGGLTTEASTAGEDDSPGLDSPKPDSPEEEDDDDDIDVAAFAFGGQNDVVMSAPRTIPVGHSSSEEHLDAEGEEPDHEDGVIMGGEGISTPSTEQGPTEGPSDESARPQGAPPRSFLSYVAAPSVPPPQPLSEEAMTVASGEAELTSDRPAAQASGALGPLMPSGPPHAETTLKTQAVDLEIPDSHPPARNIEPAGALEGPDSVETVPEVEVDIDDIGAPTEPVEIPDVQVELSSAPIEVRGSDPEIEIDTGDAGDHTEATDDELTLDEIEVEEVEASAPSDRPVPPPEAVNPPAPPALPPPDKRPKGKTSWFEAVFTDNPLRTAPRLSPAEIERQALFIAQSLQLPERAKLLDVGCGEGVQALALAQLGIDVTGVDISETMIERANNDAKTMGVNARFLTGDLRDLDLKGEYDAVLCFGTTFGYFDDETNRQVMRRLHRALRPGGYLLLDVVNRDYVIRDQPNLVWFADDGCVCMEETRFNFITSRLHVKRTIVLDDGRQREGGYSFRCYSLHELGQMMHLSGFRVAEISGSEGTKGVFFGDVSSRMIVLAERRRVAPPSTQTSVG